MTRSIEVYLLPSLIAADSLAGQTCVVIDVLRATTTIAWALAAGARSVLPCSEVEQAKRLREEVGDEALLGGERGGVKIAGFDLGNSPAEYREDTVVGRTVIFTTTNGTRAMQHVSQASRVLLAAFVNLSAVCEQLADERQIAVVCAGTNGQITSEDVLLAGAIVNRFARSNSPITLNDEAMIAMANWKAVTANLDEMKRRVRKALHESRGGRNLQSIGHEPDIEFAAQMDLLETVPELHPSTWRIVNAGENR